MAKDKLVPSFEDVPVQLSHPTDKSMVAVQNALLRLAEASAEVKEARAGLRQAQAEYVRAMQRGLPFDG